MYESFYLFLLSHYTVVCLDVNECLELPQRCEHMCENTQGGFQCLCPRGARLANDGRTCSRKKCRTLLILNIITVLSRGSAG